MALEWQVVGGGDTYKPRAAPQIEAPALTLTPFFLPPPPLPGMAWHEPPDAPVYSRKATTDPPAVALTPATLPPQIAGMAWFHTPPWFYGKTAATDPPAFAVTPATLPPKIAGMAWYEPADQPTYGRKVSTTDPGAAALTPATLPPPVSGIAWHQPPDRDPATRKPPFDQTAPWLGQPPAVITAALNAPSEPWRKAIVLEQTPPALAAAPTPLPVGWQIREDFYPFRRLQQDVPGSAPTPPALLASVSGMAWCARFDDQPRRSVAVEFPQGAVAAPAAAIPNGWMWRADEWIRRPAPIDAAGYAPPVAVTLGTAWFAPPDRDPPKRAPFDHTPVGLVELVTPLPTGWQIREDTYALRRPATDAPTALLPAKVSVGIFGMAWLAPLDELPKPAPKPHWGAGIALTPATLPVGISGIGWFAPSELQPITKAKHWAECNSVFTSIFTSPFLFTDPRYIVRVAPRSQTTK